MQSISPLSPSEAESVAAAHGIPEAYAHMQLFRYALRKPSIAQLWAKVGQTLVGSGALDPRLRELVLARVCWLVDGAYEWSNHYAIALGTGLTDDELLAVRKSEFDDAVLSDDDRLVLRFADAILGGSSPSAEAMTQLRAVLGDDGALMDLVVLPGLTQTICTFQNAMGMPLEDDKPSWPPDGVAPASRAFTLGSDTRH